MIVPDTSVVVAAFSSWHAAHDEARRALVGVRAVVAHSLFEAYSVLTRLPDPFRTSPVLVRRFLAGRFPAPPLLLDADAHRRLLERLATGGVVGGAVYDALIAATVGANGATLISCDRRAASTYARLGVAFELL